MKRSFLREKWPASKNARRDIAIIFNLMARQDSYGVFMIGSMLHPNNSDRGLLEQNLRKHSNWDTFLHRAIDTHLAPIFHKALSELDLEIPAEVKNGLHNSYNQVLLRNIILQREFQSFAKVLNEHQIPLVPLKGIYLSEVVYKDIGLRHLSDVDVLIKEQDLDHVCELMRNRGWSVKATLKHSKIEDQSFAHAHPFTLIKNQIHIELHTHLYNRDQGAEISKDELWNDTHSEQFLGIEIRQFSDELLLQHLCLHLHKHLFGHELKILSFCDIREFINEKKDSFSWQRFEQLAIRFKCKEDVGQVLYLCHLYWGVNVPNELLDIQKSKAELEDRFWGFMNGESKQKNILLKNKLSIKTRNMAHLQTNKEKLAFILGFTFPTTDFMRQCYNLNENTWLFPWYVYRPVELSIKTVKAVIGKR